MFVEHEGEGGEPTVLVHGIGSSHEVWDDMLDELGRGRDLLAVDLPGFGDSPPLPEGQRTVAGLADAIEAEMDREGWKRANLVGHSMGGFLVLELASRGRAIRTVAVAPVGGVVPEEAKRSQRMIAMERRGGALGSRVPAAMLKVIFGTGLSRRLLLRSQMSHGQNVRPERLVYAVKTMGKAKSFDELLEDIEDRYDLIEGNRERFGRISTPVLVIWGTDDRILPAAGGPRLAEAIPDAELHLMPGVGHSPLFDHPEPLARLVAGFLDAE